MSHLSDVQELCWMNHQSEGVEHRCNFAKWLLLHFPNTDTEVDPDKEYARFQQYEARNKNRTNQLLSQS